MSRFYIPLDRSNFELTIKRSVFCSFLYPFSQEEELLAFIKLDRQRYRDATHYVYAYRLGRVCNYKEGYTDDGEPSGTAGKPILSLLKRKDFFNVLVVVVRYYGGTPLGTGGLVRAYTQAAEELIRRTQWVVYIKKVGLKLIFPYNYYSNIKRFLKLVNAVEKEVNFNDKILLNIEINKEKQMLLYQFLADISAGSCQKRTEGIYELF